MTDKNEFGSQFDPVPVTPAGLVNLLDYDDRNLASLTFDGERYRLTDRFHRGLAKQLDVPYKVFNLFTPEEAMKTIYDNVTDGIPILSYHHEKPVPEEPETAGEIQAILE